ncbi:hypothetical protein VNO77_19482 [Canavalia gladiata]|uniref:P-type ATPase N-terminal domain-containing protein n=1 Tax=Canavalia gladiata TaxID=3824 RepID=A0AAN9LRE3_CANGL
MNNIITPLVLVTHRTIRNAISILSQRDPTHGATHSAFLTKTGAWNGSLDKEINWFRTHSLSFDLLKGKVAAIIDDHSQIEGRGYSIVVFCNEPETFEIGIRNYADNSMKSTKYTLATFFPTSFLEQFQEGTLLALVGDRVESAIAPKRRDKPMK